MKQRISWLSTLVEGDNLCPLKTGERQNMTFTIATTPLANVACFFCACHTTQVIATNSNYHHRHTDKHGISLMFFSKCIGVHNFRSVSNDSAKSTKHILAMSLYPKPPKLVAIYPWTLQ
jgi:hypothetical protein